MTSHLCLDDYAGFLCALFKIFTLKVKFWNSFFNDDIQKKFFLQNIVFKLKHLIRNIIQYRCGNQLQIWTHCN